MYTVKWKGSHGYKAQNILQYGNNSSEHFCACSCFCFVYCSGIEKEKGTEITLIYPLSDATTINKWETKKREREKQRICLYDVSLAMIRNQRFFTSIERNKNPQKKIQNESEEKSWDQERERKKKIRTTEI